MMRFSVTVKMLEAPVLVSSFDGVFASGNFFFIQKSCIFIALSQQKKIDRSYFYSRGLEKKRSSVSLTQSAGAVEYFSEEG